MKFTDKKILAAVLALALPLTLAGCGAAAQTRSAAPSAVVSTAELASAVPAASAAVSAVSDPEESARAAQGSFSVTAADGGTVTHSGSVWTISTAGEYTLSGAMEDGQLVVDAGDEDAVVLILDNASVSCSSGAPILILNADEVTVKAAEGSYNTVSDLRTGSADSEEYDAAIWSDCDLKLRGKGTLIVSTDFDCGVKSKDDLSVKNLTLKVTSPGAALRGSDSVTVESGTLLLISTAGDGIKTSNSDLSSKGNQRGTVSLLGGQIDIYAAGDGISAAYDAVIAPVEDCTLNIRTGSCASKAVPDGVKITSGLSSSKGIKAENAVCISGGAVTIFSQDDGVHANAGEALENGEKSVGSITVSGGTVTVSAGDDGMHVDGELTVSGGGVRIEQSHEGLEANVIRIDDGSTYVCGDDDGINARRGSAAPLVSVTGGYLEVVTPSGDTDAIDSNGSFSMTGGFVLVRGGAAMGGMAGSVDCDGSVSVTGGTIIAFGGVCSTPGSGSVNTWISGGTSFSAGDYTLTDSKGNEIAAFTLGGNYSGVWIASDALELNETYTLSRGGSEAASWTQSSGTVGSAGFGGMGGFGGQGGKSGFGGGPGMGGGRRG